MQATNIAKLCFAVSRQRLESADYDMLKRWRQVYPDLFPSLYSEKAYNSIYGRAIAVLRFERFIDRKE